MNNDLTKPVAEGVKYNQKFHFWVKYKAFNKKHISDVREFFVTEEEAKNYALGV